MNKENQIDKAAKDYGIMNPIIRYDADGNCERDLEESASHFESGAVWMYYKIEGWLNINIGQQNDGNGIESVYHGDIFEDLKKFIFE